MTREELIEAIVVETLGKPRSKREQRAYATVRREYTQRRGLAGIVDVHPKVAAQYGGLKRYHKALRKSDRNFVKAQAQSVKAGGATDRFLRLHGSTY